MHASHQQGAQGPPVLKFIFGNPDKKEWTLSLYNAVNGTSYTDASAIELTTIEDVLYMGMRNDVSFLVGDVMSMYEQQSTLDLNMPMRLLIYAGMLYSKHIEMDSSYKRYSSKPQRVPLPKCVCFYNGTREADDRSILRLSDAFGIEGEADIEVCVTMLNVNYGRNQGLMDACVPLGEYAWLIWRIRANQMEYGNIERAIERALAEMPDGMVIKPFLMGNRAEVKMMCITEYDAERAYAEQREDGRDEVLHQLSLLKQALKDAGRYDELSDAIDDRDTFEHLLVEFGIE